MSNSNSLEPEADPVSGFPIPVQLTMPRDRMSVVSPSTSSEIHMGSHEWVIKRWEEAARYVGRCSRATLASEPFMLGTKQSLLGSPVFQIRAEAVPEDHINLGFTLACLWPGRGGKEDEDDENGWSRDSLYAKFSFSLVAATDQAIIGSSCTYQERTDRKEVHDQMMGLNHPWRCPQVDFSHLNKGALRFSKDMKVVLDYKIVLTVPMPETPIGGPADMLKGLYTTKKFSDVALVAAGGHRFEAHKLLLSAKSSVFATMFSHPEMLENRTNEVRMEEELPGVVEQMLHFIYTGGFEKEDHDEGVVVQGLLQAAEKYDMQDMKLECEKFLCQTLSVENAGHLLLLADLHGATKLKVAAISLIADKMDKFVDAPVFHDITNNPQLTKEIFRVMASKQKKAKGEEDV